MKRVATIIVTYNRLELLRQAIESLRAQTYADQDIIVINNGSTDGTGEWLAGEADLTVITQENVGGAGGFERGMAEGVRRGYEFCWVMDDDIECDREALAELVRAYEVRKDAGFVCSRVLNTKGLATNTPTLSSAKQENGYTDAFDYVGTEGMVRVETSTFVSVLIPTAVIREVGLPIGEFFIWGDDTEYTLRISRKRACYMAARSVLTHKREDTNLETFMTDKNVARMRNRVYQIRNQYYIFRKYRGRWAFVKRWLADVFLLIKLIFTFDFARARVLAKALVAGVTFNPRIKTTE